MLHRKTLPPLPRLEDYRDVEEEDDDDDQATRWQDFHARAAPKGPC